VSDWKMWGELVSEYKASLKTLNGRIDELTSKKDAAIKACMKLHNDPQKDSDVIDLADRMKPIINMRNDLRELTKEVSHYYDKGWWRSEKYTFNQRKSRKFVYSRPVQR
jgi:hypothetical protein